MIYGTNTEKDLKEASLKPQNLLIRADGGFGLLDWAVNTASLWLGNGEDISGHPDAFILDNRGKMIKKEDIDRVIEFTASTPRLAPFKVVLINDFQNTNLSSQSAMLKVLEDGSEAVKFILICRGETLPTIASRCTQVMVYAPAYENFLDGKADPVVYYAVKGDCEAYERIVNEDPEFHEVLKSLPDAVFDTKSLLKTCNAVNEKTESIWDIENNRPALMGLFYEMASRALLYAFDEKTSDKTGIFDRFRCFLGDRERADRLMELVRVFDRTEKAGKATKNAFLIFLAAFSEKCMDAEGGKR